MAEKPINKGPKPHVNASADGIRHLTIHPLNTVGLVVWYNEKLPKVEKN